MQYESLDLQFNDSVFWIYRQSCDNFNLNFVHVETIFYSFFVSVTFLANESILKMVVDN